ncbi:MAG: ATPase [Alphaproteobacteria bacterium]|nr:ATPase [Alphaproteobacteria bacterium]
MKRFYKTVTVEADEATSAFSIMLDRKSVQTPARKPLQVPGEGLAAAIAAEWEAQGDEIVVGSMPLTQVAATALDRISSDVAAYVRQIAAYGETDLLCYRADNPATLVARQMETWQPLVEWVGDAISAPLTVTQGVAPIAQPPESLTALQAVVAAHNIFEMSALGLATTASGSLIIALALSQGRLDAETAFEAGYLDEMWQVEKWGTDAEAEASRATARADLKTAAQFFELCRNP